MVVRRKTEKITFCVPAREPEDSKNEKPMNKPAAIPSINLAKT